MEIRGYIRQKIRNYLVDETAVIVLKGIDISIYDEQITINLDEVLNDKLRYFFRINQDGRRVITYDEYLALYDFVLAQYKNVIILENNMFINFYPLQVKISTEKLNALLCHYDEDKEGDKYEIGDISELTLIYGNIKTMKDRHYVIYNNTVSDIKEKIFQICLTIFRVSYILK